MREPLPFGWEEIHVAELGQVVTGSTPPTNNKSTYYGGNIPFFKPPDLEAGYNLLIANDTLTSEGAKVVRALPANSVLVGCIGNIGKVALARVPCCTNQQINAIIPDVNIATPEFVYWSIRNPNFQRELENNASATTVSIINKGRFSSLRLPLPPLAEQKRIVAKLDALFDRSTRARDELARIPRLIERYKQAVLAAAFRGDLTADWRDIHQPTNVQGDCSGIDGRVSELDDLPASWAWTSLNCVAEISGGLTKNPTRSHFPQKAPYLRVANVYANELRLDDIAEIGIQEAEWARVRLKGGDLLIVEGNGSLDQLGRVALWSDEVIPCAHQNHIIKARPHEGFASRYGLFWLLSPAGRKAIEIVASSSSGLHTLSLSKVKALPVPLCTAAEMSIVVERIEAALNVIDSISAELTKAEVLRSRLEEATLAKAFRGELVPQDPNDEPASVLLERIRAERAANENGRKRKRRLDK